MIAPDEKVVAGELVIMVALETRRVSRCFSVKHEFFDRASDFLVALPLFYTANSVAHNFQLFVLCLHGCSHSSQDERHRLMSYESATVSLRYRKFPIQCNAEGSHMNKNQLNWVSEALLEVRLIFPI